MMTLYRACMTVVQLILLILTLSCHIFRYHKGKKVLDNMLNKLSSIYVYRKEVNNHIGLKECTQGVLNQIGPCRTLSTLSLFHSNNNQLFLWTEQTN